MSSVGEQFVQLLPRSGEGPALKDGDVIPMDRTTVPTDINTVLDNTNRGLEAIPRDNLKTVIDEAYIAVGGLGPELRRLVTGSTTLAIDAREEPRLADHADRPVQAGAGHPDRHRGLDPGVGGESGEHQRSAAEPGSGRGGDSGTRALGPPTRCGHCSTGCSPRCRSCWPTWSASGRWPSPTSRVSNSCSCCCLRAPRSRRPSACTSGTRSRTTWAMHLVFNLNLAIPCCRRRYRCRRNSCRRRARPASCPPSSSGCPPSRTIPTGRRAMCTAECRRTRRSTCAAPATCRAMTVPGKRAPTWQKCESDEQYVPLNDGYNWKGDPNATLSGQPIPARAAGTCHLAATPPPPGTLRRHHCGR